MEAAATVIDDMWMVRLEASGAGTVDWYRAAGSDRLLVGSGLSLVDRTTPLNVPVTYWCTDPATGESITLDPITLPADHPILSSSMHATTYEVVVDKQEPAASGRSIYHPVLEPALPVVTVLTAESPYGRLILDCPDMTTERQLWAMLTAGDPLILRTCCPGSVFDMTFLAKEWRAELKEESLPAGGRELSIEFQSTSSAPAAWTPDPDRTYQTVLDAHESYQAILDTYPSYQALLDGIPA